MPIPVFRINAARNIRKQGLTENTNGLIRQYFPKGTEFRDVTHYEARHAEQRLNNRPRKCLGFRTRPKSSSRKTHHPVAIEIGDRRPYLQHLATRFYYFQYRVVSGVLE